MRQKRGYWDSQKHKYGVKQAFYRKTFGLNISAINFGYLLRHSNVMLWRITKFYYNIFFLIPVFIFFLPGSYLAQDVVDVFELKSNRQYLLGQISMKDNLVKNDSVSLYYKPLKKANQVGELLTIQFKITNNAPNPIYVLTKPKDFIVEYKLKNKDDSWLNRDMYIYLKKFQIPEEHFEMPNLKRIDPGESYSDEAQVRLVYYSVGAKFLAHLTAYYLTDDAMNEINRILENRPTKNIGSDFVRLERELASLPIELSIVK